MGGEVEVTEPRVAADAVSMQHLHEASLQRDSNRP